ncbi:MAG: ABC transporter permease, partial [Acidobacteria bacterium]|nr:ABC transporter permease [Acidobacteriota bacterium]
MLAEIHLAFRRLRSRPAFALTAVLSLGLGIGAVTVFFSLLNSTLLKPLPVERPGELYSLVDPRYAAPVVSNPNIVDLRKGVTPFFSDLMSYRMAPVNFGMEQRANSRAWSYVVSGNYFQGLGVKAARGRVIGMEDDVMKGGHPVAVLSDLAWKRRFGADPNIVGRTVKLNNFPFTVIGVTPEGFYGTERFYAPELFVPLSMVREVELENAGYVDRRDSQNTFVIARLAPGVGAAQAQAQLDGVTAQLARQYPAENEGWKLKMYEPGWAGDYLRGSVIGFNVILMSVAGALLLVVCVNLASLLLAQAAERRKETGIRLALGANRGRLIWQLLRESFVLAAAGGGLGLLLAYWGAAAITSYRPPVEFSIQNTVQLDWRVALFASAVTLLACVAFGLVPALQSTNTDLAAAIKQDVVDPRRRRWPLRDLLTGAQIAISVVLLVCSGLMIKSLSKAMTVNVGFAPTCAAALVFHLSTAGYNGGRSMAFQLDLLRRV